MLIFCNAHHLVGFLSPKTPLFAAKEKVICMAAQNESLVVVQLSTEST